MSRYETPLKKISIYLMARNMKPKSTPPALAVKNEHSKKATAPIVAALNPLVADTFALYVKTKNFHWHMSGPHFRDYHLLLDEQADQIFEMIDVLAERARKLGGLTIHSIGEIGKLQTLKDDNDSFVSPHEMLHRLFQDNKAFAGHLLKVHKVCEKEEDVATTSLLEIFMDETERRAWFLFETIQK